MRPAPGHCQDRGPARRKAGAATGCRHDGVAARQRGGSRERSACNRRRGFRRRARRWHFARQPLRNPRRADPQCRRVGRFCTGACGPGGKGTGRAVAFVDRYGRNLPRGGSALCGRSGAGFRFLGAGTTVRRCAETCRCPVDRGGGDAASSTCRHHHRASRQSRQARPYRYAPASQARRPCRPADLSHPPGGGCGTDGSTRPACGFAGTRSIAGNTGRAA